MNEEHFTKIYDELLKLVSELELVLVFNGEEDDPIVMKRKVAEKEKRIIVGKYELPPLAPPEKLYRTCVYGEKIKPKLSWIPAKIEPVNIILPPTLVKDYQISNNPSPAVLLPDEWVSAEFVYIRKDGKKATLCKDHYLDYIIKDRYSIKQQIVTKLKSMFTGIPSFSLEEIKEKYLIVRSDF